MEEEKERVNRAKTYTVHHTVNFPVKPLSLSTQSAVVQVTHEQLQLVVKERNKEETLSLYTFNTCMVYKIEKHLRAIGLLLQFKTPLKPVYTTLDEFVKGVFTLKTHRMFSVHTTPVEFKTTTIIPT